MAHVFDGQARLIYLDSATPQVSVKGLYSDWKEWSNSTGLQYLQAFRSFGGDPTTTGQTAPAYYFLTNGWRVVVDGFDAILSYNLYTDEGDEPVITQNSGTAILNNSDVGIVQLNPSGEQAGTSVDDKLTQLLTLVQGNADGIADIQANGTGGSGGSGGSVDVDLSSVLDAVDQLPSASEIADEVETKFLFNDDGHVMSDITGAPSEKNLIRAINANFPAPVSAEAIWTAAPDWLKKVRGGTEIDLTPVLDALAEHTDQINAFSNALSLIEAGDVDLSPLMDAVADARNAINALPQREDHEAAMTQLGDLESLLVDLDLSVMGVRNRLDDWEMPDVSGLATAKELAALKSVAHSLADAKALADLRAILIKLENYDDRAVMAALNELSSDPTLARVERKVDLVLDETLNGDNTL